MAASVTFSFMNKLKQQPGKDISVSGSCQLVHTLIQCDLVDEYGLVVYPVVQGSGKRLFPNGVDTKLKLVESKQTVGTLKGEWPR
jgi:dihydrofolate reductase